MSGLAVSDWVIVGVGTSASQMIGVTGLESLGKETNEDRK